ncbi:MAG: hypothetical protein D6714_04735, partial [Bacteroidetes bacterium]
PPIALSPPRLTGSFWGKNEWFGLFWAAVTGFRFRAFRRHGSRSKFKFKFKFKSKFKFKADYF